MIPNVKPKFKWSTRRGQLRCGNNPWEGSLRLGLLAGLPTRTAAGPDANHSVQSMRQRHVVAIDLGPTRPSALSRAVDAPASEAAVMDQIGAKLENSKTISGVVAQSVHALWSQHLRNSESADCLGTTTKLK